MNSTYFNLLAEFGAAEIPLEAVCKKYFNLEPQTAKARAARGKLPVLAYRPVPSQKAGWLVSAGDLAAHLDEQKRAARAG